MWDMDPLGLNFLFNDMYCSFPMLCSSNWIYQTFSYKSLGVGIARITEPLWVSCDSGVSQEKGFFLFTQDFHTCSPFVSKIPNLRNNLTPRSDAQLRYSISNSSAIWGEWFPYWQMQNWTNFWRPRGATYSSLVRLGEWEMGLSWLSFFCWKVPLPPIIMVQWKMGVSPIMVTFQIPPFSN